MGYYLGIDLGSTTTKAVLMDQGENIIGRGITNTRSNYTVATRVAGNEAMNNARFFLLRRSAVEMAGSDPAGNGLENGLDELFSALEADFEYFQQMEKFKDLRERCLDLGENPKSRESRPQVVEALNVIFGDMEGRACELFSAESMERSQFFRDIAGSEYLRLADEQAKARGIGFEELMGIYDKSIIQVENRIFERSFHADVRKALKRTSERLDLGEGDGVKRVMELLDRPEPVGGGSTSSSGVGVFSDGLPIENTVGTGYGRQQLPFKREQIRSEILCHGLGAHYMFPNTSTVLDVGGQDTKAIQVNPHGIVKSFQMNDRCAAGCGRYLGYIADELNMGLHQLGPLSLKATRTVRINSTCTVFAGAELRERLSLGESRENILAGLHRAIILRAMSLLARSGGVFSEFTFTGGVAKNAAVVKSLRELVKEHYDVDEVNIDPDSIYTGAVGAALFALQG